MMEVIADLPDDIIGIAVRGKITRRDYHMVLIPATLDKLSRHNKLGIFCTMGPWEGIEMGAVREDVHFGLNHWRDFSHAAVVMPDGPLKALGRLLAPLHPAKTRFYRPGEEYLARAWLVSQRPSHSPTRSPR